jgi:AGZA family xanthine/uracil permease-like MFS transporter
VNASIVADSGGTCVCNTTDPAEDPFCAANDEYLLCKGTIKRDLITATAAISAFSSFFMGLLANM